MAGSAVLFGTAAEAATPAPAAAMSPPASARIVTSARAESTCRSRLESLDGSMFPPLGVSTTLMTPPRAGRHDLLRSPYEALHPPYGATIRIGVVDAAI